MTVDEAMQLLQAASLFDHKTLEAVREICHTEEAVTAAQSLIGKGADHGPMWAATYVYSMAGPDAAVLLPLAKHQDPTIRLFSARALVARGDRRGFAPLIELLTQPGYPTGIHPPIEFWVLATQELVLATGLAQFGPPFDADSQLILAAQQRWRSWLAANETRLTFDNLHDEWNVL